MLIAFENNIRLDSLSSIVSGGAVVGATGAIGAVKANAHAIDDFWAILSYGLH